MWPRVYQPLWRYSLYLPTCCFFCLFSPLAPCRGPLQREPVWRPSTSPGAPPPILQVATGWRSRPRCAGSGRAALGAGGASCLPWPPAPGENRAPRGARKRRGTEGGCLPGAWGAASQLWGQVGLNKFQGPLKRSGCVPASHGQDRAGKCRERRGCWSFFPPREALLGRE